MIGENVTDAQLNEMLALADLDKDGKINYEGKHNEIFHLMKLKGFLSFQSLHDCSSKKHKEHSN